MNTNGCWLPALLATTILVASSSRFVHAEKVLPSHVTTLAPVNRKDRATAEKRGFYPLTDWMAAPWTGSDKPFTSVRSKIDRMSEQNTFTRPVLAQYRQEAQKHPKDPVAQFGWGYSYYKSRNDGVLPDMVKQDQDTSLDIAWSLAQAPSPHSYEYTRLQFLINAQNTVAFLSPVGKRLIKHTPEDYDVEYYFYPSLLSSSLQADKDKALLGARELIKRYPQRGGPYSVLATVYTVRWENGDAQSGPLAVAASQKYLSMPPKGLTLQQREGLEQWMNFIRTHPQGPKGPKIE